MILMVIKYLKAKKNIRLVILNKIKFKGENELVVVEDVENWKLFNVNNEQ